MTKDDLKSRVFIGVVEDNEDPKKLGRCKIRVKNVFETIPLEDLPWAKPWKDLNGNAFSVPDKGKVVSVVFDTGSIYRPEYICAEHYNVNLEEKLKKMPKDDYATFKALLFDHSTQVYRTKSEGLKIDHEYTHINIDPDGNIYLNLRSNSAHLRLGTKGSNQQAILGNHFMDWMSQFLTVLVGTPYLGNKGAPIAPAPDLLSIVRQFFQDRDSKFLSHHVNIVDNKKIEKLDRFYKDQQGDDWNSTNEPNTLTKSQPTTQPPQPPPNTPPGTPPANTPQTNTPQDPQSLVEEANNQTLPDPTDQSFGHKTGWNNAWWKATLSSERYPQVKVQSYENGKIPTDKMLKNEFLAKTLPEPKCLLLKDASLALDKLISAYDAATFPGKQILEATGGYRNAQQQDYLANDFGYRSVAAKTATASNGDYIYSSPHGFGTAIDLYFGVPPQPAMTGTYRLIAFAHPVYRWLYNNAHLYGFFNNDILRNNKISESLNPGIVDQDGSSSNDPIDEWWHFEYRPDLVGKTHQQVLKMPDKYNILFTTDHIKTLVKRYGGSFAGYGSFGKDWPIKPETKIDELSPELKALYKIT